MALKFRLPPESPLRAFYQGRLHREQPGYRDWIFAHLPFKLLMIEFFSLGVFYDRELNIIDSVIFVNVNHNKLLNLK